MECMKINKQWQRNKHVNMFIYKEKAQNKNKLLNKQQNFESVITIKI